MIKYLNKQFNDLYFRDHKMLHLHDYKCCSKSLLILSNLIYIIILLYLLRINIKNKLFIIISCCTIFIISSIYHYYQCYSSNYKNYTILKCCDITFVGIFVMITLLLFKIKLNFRIIVLLILSIIVWQKRVNKELYVYFHSAWHILSGLTLFVFLYETRDKN